MSKLSIVIPALNEQDAIAQILGRILAIREGVWARAGITSLSVLVVDDGSTDGTADIVRALVGRQRMGRLTIQLISHGANRGYGAALQTGFAAADGSLLAFLDADGTYPPEELPALCRALARSGKHLAVGSRMSGSSSRMPLLRWFGNTLFAVLASLLAGRQISDCCSGMRVLPLATWRRLGPLPSGLDFTPAMTIRALHEGLDIEEVSIAYDERIGRSKLKIIRDGLRFLATMLHETREHRPERLWITASLATAFPLLGLLSATIILAASPGSLGKALGLVVPLTLVMLAGLSLVVLGMSAPVRPAISRFIRVVAHGGGKQSVERRDLHSDEYVSPGGSGSVAARPH